MTLTRSNLKYDFLFTYSKGFFILVHDDDDDDGKDLYCNEIWGEEKHCENCMKIHKKSK